MMEFVSWDYDILNVWKVIIQMFQTTNQLLSFTPNEMRSPTSSRSNSGPLRKNPRMPEMRTSYSRGYHSKKAGLRPTPGQGCELGNKEVKLLISPPCGYHIGWSRAARDHSSQSSQFPSGRLPSHNSNMLNTTGTMAY